MKRLILVLSILAAVLFTGCSSLQTEKPIEEIKISCTTKRPIDFYVYSADFTSDVYSLENGESVVIDNLENTTGPYTIKFKYQAESGYHEKTFASFESDSDFAEIQIMDDSYGKIYPVLL